MAAATISVLAAGIRLFPGQHELNLGLVSMSLIVGMDFLRGSLRAGGIPEYGLGIVSLAGDRAGVLDCNAGRAEVVSMFGTLLGEETLGGGRDAF
jgi:hypothetical protein